MSLNPDGYGLFAGMSRLGQRAHFIGGCRKGDKKEGGSGRRNGAVSDIRR